MPRTTLRFSGDDVELYELLDDLADERDRSINYLVIDAVRQVYGDVDSHRDDVASHRTDAERIDAERIDAIEHRLDVVEHRVDELSERPLDGPPDEPGDDDRDGDLEREPEPELDADDLEGDDDVDDAIESALAGWKPGRVGSDREERRHAGRAAVEFVRDAPAPVTAVEIKNSLTPELLVDDEKPASWWERTARPAIKHARDAGLIELDGKTYEWVA